MNNEARGIERLFNDEDRKKLKDINGELHEFLDDLTAEENDLRYGYINGANAMQVPIQLDRESSNFPYQRRIS